MPREGKRKNTQRKSLTFLANTRPVGPCGPDALTPERRLTRVSGSQHDGRALQHTSRERETAARSHHRQATGRRSKRHHVKLRLGRLTTGTSGDV